MKQSLEDVRDRDEALRWVVEWLRHHIGAQLQSSNGRWGTRENTALVLAEELERLLDCSGVRWDP